MHAHPGGGNGESVAVDMSEEISQSHSKAPAAKEEVDPDEYVAREIPAPSVRRPPPHVRAVAHSATAAILARGAVRAQWISIPDMDAVDLNDNLLEEEEDPVRGIDVGP